jgi:nucleoside-diphosphate-sugar epimerase
LRILVTGSSGFIGTVLCKVLRGAGHEVMGMVRAGSSGNLVNSWAVPYQLGDKLPKSAIRFSPEVVVNLAWEGIPDFSVRQCVENVESHIRFLEFVAEVKSIRKIVVSGTCREYGNKTGCCSENDFSPPMTYFDWAKQTLRNLYQIHTESHDIDLVWLRLFYVFGPGQRSGALIPHLIKALRSRVGPDIKSPLAANDYIYIGDVVAAFVLAIEREGLSGIFNVGSGRLTSTMAIVKMVSDVLGYGSSHNLSEMGTLLRDRDNSIGAYADIRKIGSELGWSPKTSLYEGIQTICEAMH